MTDEEFNVLRYMPWVGYGAAFPGRKVEIARRLVQMGFAVEASPNPMVSAGPGFSRTQAGDEAVWHDARMEGTA